MIAAFVRSVLYSLFMLVTVVFWAFAIIFSAPFTNALQRYAIASHWTRMMTGLGGRILGIQTKVHGLENLPVDTQRPVVLLVKHQSTWETFFMAGNMPRPLAFVFKKELLYLPFFGWAIGLVGMIYIDRSQGRKAFERILEQGEKVMKQGRWVIFFPEGTRIPRGQVGTYKTGGTHLACATKALVIPVAATTARVWPKKAFLKRPGVVDIVIGQAIDSTGRKPNALMQEVQEWIEGQMRRFDAEAYPAASNAAVSTDAAK